jgi:4-amino-4-deoxy-L-arabinose transferase-like glycosyltransferase
VFILEHNFSRFGTNLYHHPQPIWFYVPVVLIGLLPWAVFVIAALGETIRAWWAEKASAYQPKDAFNLFLAIWFVLPVVFFSLSQSKLPGYILPALPAGTLLLAEYVRRRSQDNQKSSSILILLHSVMAALLPPLALLLQYIVIQHRIPLNLVSVFALTLTIALSLAIGVTLRSHPGLRLLRFVTPVSVFLAIFVVMRFHVHFLDERFSTRPLSETISHVDNGSLPTAVLKVSREIEYGLHFYRNQSIARYESGEIPAGEHILIAPHALTSEEIKQKLPGRRVSYLGTDQPQHLDYFWISQPGMTMDHMKM